MLGDQKINLQTPYNSPLDNLNTMHQDNLRKMQATMDSIQEMRDEEYRREQNYKNSVLNTLQSIEKNTGNLYEIAYLLKEGNVARDEIYLLFEKMFSILNAKSKEEAEGVYKKTMQEVTNMNTGADVIIKLSAFGKMLIDAISSTPAP